MKHYRAFILDDDNDSVDRLAVLLSRYPAVRITGTETNAMKALSFLRSNKPDLIFMDIEMPGLSGLEMADRIRDKDYDPVIIFVTGYEKYAINAIRISAYDYLLKPVSISDLDSLFSRLSEQDVAERRNVPPVHANLTSRESEVLEYLLAGFTSMEISGKMSISKNTVDTHRRNILKRLGAKNTSELIIRYAGARD